MAAALARNLETFLALCCKNVAHGKQRGGIWQVVTATNNNNNRTPNRGFATVSVSKV
jgi:hypothetical protein